MFPHFPDLHQSMEGQPFPDGALEGLFILVSLCAICYLLPFLSLVCFIKDKLSAAQVLGGLGVALPSVSLALWVVFNPMGIWYILLPIVAPGAFVSYLQFNAARRRIFLRKNPTNLIPFRKLSAND